MIDAQATASAKKFLIAKQPKTDLERILCLAHYHTHFLHRPEFTAADLASLNSEAGLTQLSNPSFAVRKAVKQGLLDSASERGKRLTVSGEALVASLPRG